MKSSQNYKSKGNFCIEFFSFSLQTTLEIKF